MDASFGAVLSNTRLMSVRFSVQGTGAEDPHSPKQAVQPKGASFLDIAGRVLHALTQKPKAGTMAGKFVLIWYLYMVVSQNKGTLI